MTLRSTEVLWRRPATLASFARLDTDLHTEVAVIGGGITGLTTALLLAEAGKSVTLLEGRELCSGVSRATTAHLTEAVDERYHRLESSFGREGAKLVRQSSRFAIEMIAELSTNSDCGFERVDGYLFTESEAQRGELDAEALAAERAGATVARVNEVPLPLQARGGLVFKNQAQFRPLDYLGGLVTRLRRSAIRIHEDTQVLDVESKGQLRLQTSTGHSVVADAVVLATHAPFQALKLQLELAQYRSYAVAGRLHRPLRGLFWDMNDPYHYVRSVQRDGQAFAMVGGGDHRTGATPEGGHDEPFRELDHYLARLGSTPELRWSAQVVEPSDGLPFIGKPHPEVELYVAQGFAGNGMTFGTLAAKIISDQLLRKANPYAELYRATRLKPMASAAAVIAENAQTVGHLAAGHLKPASSDPIEDLPAGEGRIFKLEGKRLAVCRDRDGALHAVSSVCTHQGCEVAFNPTERSWDCPCHGPRFDIDGKVLDGPAKRPLEKHQL